jgi:hypothetical protein
VLMEMISSFVTRGCACYPNLSTKATHKLAPRSTRYVFLGYSIDHKGYRSLNLSTNNIVVSRHVIFYEEDFSFLVSPCLTNNLDIFLHDDYSGVAPMLAPLPVPRVPSEFSSRTTAGGQNAYPDSQIAPGTEAGSMVVRLPSE